MNVLEHTPPKYEAKAVGDTYERYRQRCWIWDMQPSPFSEWLAYELKMFGHTGSHVLFDKQQRIDRQRARRTAMPIDRATVCPTVANS